MKGAVRFILVIGIAFVFSMSRATADDKPSDAAASRDNEGHTTASDKPALIPELNTILMQSTFRIHGPKKGANNQISFGTAFLVGKPTSDITKQYYVLVTAAHVFDEIQGENATLTLRKKQDNGSYTQIGWNIKLRDNDKNIYVKHPDADVAVLYVDMPDDLNVPIVPIDLLGSDDMLSKFEIHPGDQLFCLGFPLWLSSDFGFPILRSGKIASFPIVPTNITKTIFYDAHIFDGNSGGPVYFVDHDRIYGKLLHIGEVEQFVVGVVTAKIGSKLFDNQLVDLAQIVPSSFIHETIKLLPATSPYK